jgi:hypothetical protein
MYKIQKTLNSNAFLQFGKKYHFLSNTREVPMQYSSWKYVYPTDVQIAENF